jgi:membrane associated rhomboid family serine protease
VAEGNKSVRQARTQFGGALSTSSPGLVTRILIGVNVAIFLWEQVGGIDKAANRFGLLPVSVANGEYYRLVTAAFLHASLWHIGFNMVALWFLGTPLEALVGRSRFVLIYALSLLGGSVASFCFSPALTTGIGASGAIFGVMGAFAVVAWRQKWDLRPFVFLIGLNLVIGFLPGSDIDWRAHLGGLVTGAVVAAAIVLPSRQQRRLVLAATSVALVVVLVAMTAWRTADLQSTIRRIVYHGSNVP